MGGLCVHPVTHTYIRTPAHSNAADKGKAEGERSSFLICYPSLSSGQHIVEGIPADARSVEDRKKQRHDWLHPNTHIKDRICTNMRLCIMTLEVKNSNNSVHKNTCFFIYVVTVC